MGEFEGTLRSLITVGLALLLVMLRLDAERFGAAEYDEAARDGHMPSVRRRLAWYVLGVGLVLAILFVHPAPDADLFLGVGDRVAAIIGGLLFAIVGAGQAVAFAWLRYRHLRLPDVRVVPGRPRQLASRPRSSTRRPSGARCSGSCSAPVSRRRPRTSSRRSSTRSRPVSARPAATATCSSWPC